MRLLVVEDDALLGQGIEAGLKQAGFTVDRAVDGRAAALALDAVDYELLVLDLGLPKMRSNAAIWPALSCAACWHPCCLHCRVWPC